MIELRENAVRIKNGKQSKLNEICNNQVFLSQPQYYTHSEQYVEIVQKRCKLLDFYAVALFRSNPVTEIIKSNSTS